MEMCHEWTAKRNEAPHLDQYIIDNMRHVNSLSTCMSGRKRNAYNVKGSYALGKVEDE